MFGGEKPIEAIGKIEEDSERAQEKVYARELRPKLKEGKIFWCEEK